MKPVDLAAVSIGTASGAIVSDSAKEILTAAAASAAVYLIRYLIACLRARFPNLPNDDGE